MKLYVSRKKNNYKKGDGYSHTEIKNFDTIFVHMTKDEALETIESLSRQIRTKNPNDGRAEHYDDFGNYFSISVDISDEYRWSEFVEKK